MLKCFSNCSESEIDKIIQWRMVEIFHCYPQADIIESIQSVFTLQSNILWNIALFDNTGSNKLTPKSSLLKWII